MRYEKIKPPLRYIIVSTLRDMPAGMSHLFEGANPSSVRSVLTRVTKQHPKRRYLTRVNENGDVRVWRTV